MNAEKGFYCFPEVDLGLPISQYFLPLLHGRLSVQTLTKSVLTGKRWGGNEAQAVGIVDQSLPDKELLQKAIAHAQGLAGKGSNRQNMTRLKTEIYDVSYKGLTKKKDSPLPSLSSKY
eukprot:TRINITY_DN3560_c0_g1_i1.p2 TRINITY_DN3560_c0_g1~~TRINITY_DN3560_c0_g1_i1.p2  ORF type:complete len:118 (+),score=23.57 TRINITY_DN3560_c0_g1_i1:438-791(+)